MAHKTTYENGFKAKVALEAVRGDKDNRRDINRV